MNWPFVSRRFHESIAMVLTDYTGKLEQRVKELEAERRLLLDRISLLGIGAPIYHQMPQPEEQPESTEKKQTAEPAMPTRPSQIMRMMDRKAEARWLRKVKPSAAVNQQRAQVMAQFDQADNEAAHIK